MVSQLYSVVSIYYKIPIQKKKEKANNEQSSKLAGGVRTGVSMVCELAKSGDQVLHPTVWWPKRRLDWQNAVQVCFPFLRVLMHVLCRQN